ncbi:helix-turn-helix domain-containing protein [Pseudobacteriovorax antillogorgiicola]|uniref:DnaJ domain-containing protein n=1 Tax=Pseudobacteriovorax antillogorgiicola TaxID=1513793 RepID=A0A1Y6BBZ3_9BACT|nr:helix-turn-helix domain-containing protein [Pseudobacteriovorax antillogorgiicola]TCS58924.1 DnaJ-like protein [Pseudobacteriovorax antillogorgiicola]SME93070.1 DnaJ domain-containing protein [Pseudobacteriovorax antillogorgiicola]
MGGFEKDSGYGNDIKAAALGSLSGQSFYEVLEISHDASRIQIREAYIRLKNTYSQGNQALYSLISEEDAQESLDSLEEAYRVLYDDRLRKDYDQALLEAKSKRRGALDPFANDPKSVSLTEEPAAAIEGEEDVWGERKQAANKPRKETANTMRFAGSALSENIQEEISRIITQSEECEGSVLKALREVQGVSLDELQERTKVSLQYIIALENNDFHTLPSIVYVKGFLKILFQYLGVRTNTEQMIDKYLEYLKHWQKSKGIEQS